MAEDETIGVVDIVVIVLYFAFVIGVGFVSMCRPNRGTSKGYFLAGRDMMWFLVGASLFASNIGSYHFVGLAGSGAAAGWGAGAYELNALYFLQLLGWLFLPVYVAGAVYTMPEYLQKRFGGERIRLYYSILSLLLYVFTKISVDMFSGALFIQESLGWNLWVSIGVLLLITAVYTIIGGLAAVMYTDAVQFVIMMAGGITLMVISFIEVGGLSGLIEKYPEAYPNATVYYNDSCGIPRDDAFKMFRDPVDSDMPWPGFLLGQSPASLWYWCADQVIVQRALAGRNMANAKGGTLLAGYFKILPMFMIIMPGMIARVLWPDEIACVDPDVCLEVCNNPTGCSNIAYPTLVMRLLPIGVRGLMLAVMLSALMSSLTSIFNSGATIFTIDIWKRIRKDASERELMVVGRIFVGILAISSILWIPMIANSQGGQLWHYIQEISGYLTPPIAAVFVLAVLWGRITEPGTFWSLMVGLLGGVIRFILVIVYPDPKCGEEDTRPAIVSKIHYFYVAMILFWLTLVLCIIISLMTKPIPKNKLYRLTFWTRHSKEERQDIDAVLDDEDFQENGTVNKSFDADKINLEELGTKDSGNGSDGDSNTTDSALGSVGEKNDAGKDQVNSKSTATDVESGKEGIETEIKGESSKCGRMYDWLCGYSSNVTEESLSEEERKAAEAKLTDITETTRESVILNINLVLICLIGLALFIIFGFDFLWV